MTRSATDILEARAEALAREPDAQAKAAHRDVLQFQVASENYALDVADVLEVHSRKDVTPLPCAPPFVIGMINVRGKILTVIDLYQFFEVPYPRSVSEPDKVIRIHFGAMQLGVLADDLVGVRPIPLGEIQMVPSSLTGLRMDFFKGITDGRIALLDVEKILSAEKMSAMGTAE